MYANVTSISQVTVGTSAVQLSSGSNMAQKVIVRALSANTAKVYVGLSSSVSTSNGWELTAGESVTIDCLQPNKLYAISGSASQGVCLLIS